MSGVVSRNVVTAARPSNAATVSKPSRSNATVRASTYAGSSSMIRTSIASFLSLRERDAEDAPLGRDRFDLHRSAVGPNHVVHDREAKPCSPAAAVPTAVDPIEAFEDAINMLSADTDSLIANRDRHAALIARHFDFNGRIAIWIGVLHRVVEQIRDRRYEMFDVAINDRVEPRTTDLD